MITFGISDCTEVLCVEYKPTKKQRRTNLCEFCNDGPAGGPSERSVPT
ncbi:hypothetical protein BVRB_2g025960 [Beta vulgaris subsp. vulgaris]|nr:hypothetical protein BVRB_2g025960 [Beta vulgaris subsp. vulgaris]